MLSFFRETSAKSAFSSPYCTAIAAAVIALSGATAVHANQASSKAAAKKAKECDVTLMQKDFRDGTYQIFKSGTYCLGEDISFNPNNLKYLREKLKKPELTAYESGFPLRSQYGKGPDKYDPEAYGIGFFAAIAVSAADVVIDLKGHKIEQSVEHALIQRFFTVISLADRPFIKGQGPHDFGLIVGAAENTVVKNGVIGRSSHHGIHANRAAKITIEDIEFDGFEVGAVALNGVRGTTMKNLKATSRTDLPVLGVFSAAQFIKPYVNFLVQSKSKTTFNGKTPEQIQAALRKVILDTYEDLVTKGRSEIDADAHPEAWKIFHNKASVVDGNAYGFLVNGVGVAVNGFPSIKSTKAPATDVVMENLQVISLGANVREIVAVATDKKDTHAKDPVGSAFQIYQVDPRGNSAVLTKNDTTGVYVGNPVADAQMLVARAANNKEFPKHLSIKRNTIIPALVDWAESGTALSNYTSKHPGANGTGFVCNGDQMFHVNKGVVAFKIDGAVGVDLKELAALSVTNTGKLGSDACGAYEKSHHLATQVGYGGAAVRGMSVSGSKNVKVDGFVAQSLKSYAGSAIGIDVMMDSEEVRLSNIFAAIDLIGNTHRAPTAKPEAIGFKVAKTSGQNVWFINFCAKGKNDTTKVRILKDASGKADKMGRCKDGSQHEMPKFFTH